MMGWWRRRRIWRRGNRGELPQIEPPLAHSDEHTTTDARLLLKYSTLRPQNILLATRRSKRCRICRHILVKPEAKLSSSRYKIRLLAQNYLPSITARLLTPNTAPVPSPNFSTKPSMTNSTSISTTGLITATLPRLVPGGASQHTITFQNPRFDPLSIRLAAPTHVPGPPSFSLTILCPQFEVGANADLWDEALLEPGGVARGVGGVGTGARGVMGEGKGERRRTAEEKGDGQRSDVGSVWERGRNWTSVVFEVVPDAKPPPPPPAPIPQPAPSTSTSTPAAAGLPTAEATAETPKKPPLLPPRPTSGGGGMKGVLEVPVFVKMAWKGETAAGTERGGAGAGTGGREGGQGGKEEEEEERTVEFWCAIPLGTVG